MAMAAPTVGGLHSAISSLSSTSASPCCSSAATSSSSSSASSTGGRAGTRLGLGRSSLCGSSVSGGFFSAGLAGSRLPASSHHARQKQARRAVHTTAVLADVVAQETVYRIWWLIPSVLAVSVACFYPVIEVLFRKGSFVEKSRVDPRTVVSVILGGGAGTRLFPLTKRRAKPAVPIGGNYRLIDVPMSNCINSGINKVFILTQFNSASLNRHLARTYNFGNGVNFGDGFVEVLAATQRPGETGMNWFQGTADAVRQFMWLFEVLAATQTTGEGGLEWFQGTADAVRQYLWLFEDAKNKDIEHVLILSGDHLYRMNYMDFVQKHKDTGADITISCVPMDDSRASDFGLMKIDDTGRVLYFSEKPKGADLRAMQVDTTVLGLSSEEAKKKPYIASMGIYVFKKDILLKLLRWRYPAANDFGSEIIPASAKEFNVQAYLFDDYWEDIGTIKSFYEANLALTAQPPKFSFYDADKPIFTSPRYLPPTKVDKCRITDSIVSHGCFLRECSVVHSIVGVRSRLETGVELKDSLMLGADFYETDVEMAALLAEGKVPMGIGENSKISNAIIDKNARIGRNVIISNSDNVLEAERPSEGFYIRSGITVILKNSTIKDGTVI